MLWKLLISTLMVCILPILFMFHFTDPVEPVHPQTEATVTPTAQYTQETVKLLDKGEIVRLPLEEYVVQVILAEMPADFEMEALKAQAVVARTFTCRRLTAPKHNTAAVCTDPACCQAFLSQEDYRNAGGMEESVQKVMQAVNETAGQVLVYNGELIEATYFSCSGGRTEDAQAVWGSDLPYLQSVESPGEEQAEHYTDSVTFTARDFCDKMNISPQGQPGTWIGNITYTDGGGVEQIEIGGSVFTGTLVRQLLGLRSTAFVITAAGSSITVTTKGYGHRVGMSQYGADAMALQGSDYKAILQHYYQGTELVQYALEG